MPEHPLRQPLNAGFTLVELMLAASISAVIALVSALLFKAGMVSYLYSYRQATALTAARASLSGDGSKTGLLWEAEEAKAVQSLNASTLTLTTASLGTVSYYVTGGGSLYRVAGSSASVLATGVSSLALNYYNLNATGAIIESTAAVSANLVTARLTVVKKSVSDKDHVYFAGARLRNHP
jgi:prepilin-type N-terminal cleavage/methylation domain-containing protein